MNCDLIINNKKYPISSVELHFGRRQTFLSVGQNAAIVASKEDLKLVDCVIQVDSVTINCHIIKTERIDVETIYVWLIGGHGGINNVVKEKNFIGPTLGQIANYLVNQTGEQLDNSSDSDVLQSRSIGSSYVISSQVKMWRQLLQLCERVGSLPQMTIEGKIRITRNSNPTTFTLPKKWQLLQNTAEGLTKIYVDEMTILPTPGQVYENQIIERVILQIKPEQTTILLTNSDYIDNELGQIKNNNISHGTFRAIVITQLPNWKLKVKPVDRINGLPDITEARIRYGSPLMSARVNPGTIVSVSFDSQGEPYVDAFESKYSTSTRPDTTDEILYVGDPTTARQVARTNDGVITYMPSGYELVITIPIQTVGGDTIPAGSYPIKIVPIPGSTSISLPGLIKTGAKFIKAE